MTVTIRPYTKHGNTGWEVDIRGKRPDGRAYRERVKAPVSTKNAAKRWGEEREHALLFARVADAAPPKKQAPTLRTFAPRFIEEHARANRNKPSTVESKESAIRAHLDPVLGDLRLDQIDDAVVQKLKAHLRTKSPKTVNNILSLLRTLLRVAVEWHELDAMPCTIRMLKVPKDEAAFYDFETLGRIVGAAARLSVASEVFVCLGADAGLRLGEIAGLTWADVNLETGMISVRRSDWRGHVTEPKGGRGRHVPMTSRLRDALTRHSIGPKRRASERVILHGHVSCGPKRARKPADAPLTKKVAHRWMARILDAAGVPRGTIGRLHILRHTFCSHLAMHGAPAISIQHAAGHASVSTTQRYMHLQESHLAGAIQLLDRPAPGVSGDAAARGDIGETERKRPDTAMVPAA